MNNEEKKAVVDAVSQTAGDTHAAIAAISAVLAVLEPTDNLRAALSQAFEKHYSILLGLPWAENHVKAFEHSRALIEAHVGIAYQAKI